MKQVTMSQVKQDLADCLKTARRETVVITSRGKPTGVLIGFETDEDWSDYQLETDPDFCDGFNKRETVFAKATAFRWRDSIGISANARKRNVRSGVDSHADRASQGGLEPNRRFVAAGARPDDHGAVGASRDDGSVASDAHGSHRTAMRGDFAGAD